MRGATRAGCAASSPGKPPAPSPPPSALFQSSCGSCSPPARPLQSRPSDHEPGGDRIGHMSQRAVFAAVLLALGLVAAALFVLREGAGTSGVRSGTPQPDGSVAARPGGGASSPDLSASEEEDGA